MSSRLLDDQRLHGVYAATMSAGLAAQRDILLLGIDPEFVGILSDAPTRSAQILVDLHALNCVLRDGSVPLGRWLKLPSCSSSS